MTAPNGTAPAALNGSGSSASSSADPFAGLPRLRFDDSYDPADLAYPSNVAPAPPPSWSQAPSSASTEVSPVNGSSNGRRHGATEDEQSVAPVVPAGGGRRRRAEGETNDVLARLLGDH